MNALKYELKRLKTKTDLKRWLGSNTISESRDWEFKEMIPDKRNKKNQERLCHAFAAFANKHGGFIFFGIEDGTKKIVGIEKNNEFRSQIDSKISKISPRIDKWDLINVIDLKNSRFVYIVFIEESEYFRKPHVYNFSIYIRRNGSCEPIDNGPELREIINPEEFSPYSHNTMSFVFDRIKGKKEYGFIDGCYMVALREYLEKRKNDASIFHELLVSLNEIINEHRERRKSISVEYVVEGGAIESSFDSPEEFSGKIDVFIANFNSAHN